MIKITLSACVIKDKQVFIFTLINFKNTDTIYFNGICHVR